jgi:hypothetical protein
MKRVIPPAFLIKRKNTVIEISSSLFILLFVYTALSKLTDYNFFVAQLNTHPGINKYADTIAWSIPGAELLISVMLLIPRTRVIGLYGSLGLMAVFTVYLLYMLQFGEHLPCSCGGVIKYMTWKQHVAFNSFFIVVAILGLWLSKLKPGVRHNEIIQVTGSYV